MMVFEGVLTGMGDARKVSEAAWDFESINAAYRVYLEFADGFRVPGAGDISGLLREERRIWWEAVRQDPLLPRELLPKGYMGEKAWKTRRKLLGKLHKKFLSKMAVS
jgi:DNA-binding transcriptional regulator PaaX